MAELIRYNDTSKGPVESRVVEGMFIVEDLVKLFLPDKTIEEHIENIRNLAMRDDDIVVCAYAKCGRFLMISFTLKFNITFKSLI